MASATGSASGYGPAGMAKAAVAAKEAGDGPPPSVATLEYWEEFYSHRRAAWDTLYNYDEIKAALANLMMKSRPERSTIRILHVGCGTSAVTEGLWRDGFRNICNIDFSEVVIRLMAQRWEELAANVSDKGDVAEAEAMRCGVQWLAMDVAELSNLTSASFDVVLEKFTFDAMLADAKDDATDPRGCSAVRELHRVIAPSGVLISIAWGEKRRPVMLRGGGLFSLDCQRLPGNSKQRPMVYICKKQRPSRELVAGPVADATASVAPAAEAAAAASAQHASGAGSRLGHQLCNQDADSSTSRAERVCSTGNAGVLLDVIVVEGVVEVRIDFTASLGPRLRREDIQLDVSTEKVRWRLADIGGENSELAGWSHAQLPSHVDSSAAVARWTRPKAKNSDQGRTVLEVKVPLLVPNFSK